MTARQTKIDEHHTALTIAVANLGLTAEQVRWNYIHLVFETCERNVSAAARRLGMHRRTLQRVLGKSMPKRNARVSL